MGEQTPSGWEPRKRVWVMLVVWGVGGSRVWLSDVCAWVGGHADVLRLSEANRVDGVSMAQQKKVRTETLA